jgi:hypothetical protein
MRKMSKTCAPFPRKRLTPTGAPPLSEARLAEMIDVATTDAYDLSEQVSGFFTMIDDHLAVPFETSVLGVDAVVQRVELTRTGEIVAVYPRIRRTSTPMRW